MKLETLETFLNKDQELWNREDIEKLRIKYGDNAVFYDTSPHISNRLLMLLKHRDIAVNDVIILDFITNKNTEYVYVIDYISNYIDHIDFVFWPAEKPLYITYKILCEKVLSDTELKYHSETHIKLKELAKKISSIRYKFLEAKNKEDSNESK